MLEPTISGERWILTSEVTDLDEAWDEAKSRALEIWGTGFSGGGLYPEDFAVDNEPALVDRILREGSKDSGASARAVGQNRDWSKRKARVSYSETDFVFETGICPRALSIDECSDELVVKLLQGTDKHVDEGESVSSVVLVSLRQRIKVVITRNRGKSERRFAVVDGDRIIGRYANSALAVSAAREASSGGKSHSVWALGGRESGLSMVDLVPEVASQRAALNIIIAKTKVEGRNRVGGWVFSGPTAMGMILGRESSTKDTSLEPIVAALSGEADE